VFLSFETILPKRNTMSRRSSLPNLGNVRDRSLQRWATALIARANANLAQGGENAEQVAQEVPVVPREVAAMAELIAQEEVPTRTLGAPQVGTMHLEYTNRDPIGKLMLQLVRDNMELREHSGAEAGTNIDLGSFCTAFYNKAQVEKNQLEERLRNTEKSIQHNLIQNKLKAHDELTSHPPPSYYSPQDTLTSSALTAQSMKLFPNGSGKFSGHKGKDGDYGVGVIEFLSSMNRAQAIAKLSREEFKNQLLNSTTGRAHSLLVDWFNNGEAIEDCYFNLIVNFDKRTTVEDARARLANYKALKTANLAKVEADIMSLASRASTSLPAGDSRQALYNLDATMALIRALPPTSSATASNTFAAINAELQRAATFTELSKAVNVYRHVIDADIRAHGMATSKDRAPVMAGQAGSKKQWGNKKVGKATSFGISGAPIDGKNAKQGNNPQAGRQNHGQNQSMTAWNQGGPVDGQRGPSFGRNQQDGHSKSHQKGGQGQFRGKGKGPYRGNKQGGYPVSTYCSLCGNTDHTAGQGCPFMQNNLGQVIKYQPIQGVCGACPPCIMPRLNHAEKICPYRKGGPLHGTAL
jgi:hypothetical protein